MLHCLQRDALAVKLPTFLLTCNRASGVANTQQGSCTGAKESKNTTSIYSTRFGFAWQRGKLGTRSASAVVFADKNCLNMFNLKYSTSFERKLIEAKYASS